MCVHITLGGTSTKNPYPGNVFDYIHHAINCTADFILDSIQGTGLTGLYASSEYRFHDPILDAWTDTDLGSIWEQVPIQPALYVRAQGDHQKFMKAIVRCVAVMMNEYQLHHIDMPTVFALSPEQWRVWCMQWHMFKRDYELSRTYSLIPEAGYRYEVVCVYLETLLRLEVTETEYEEGGEHKKKVQVYPNPWACPYCDFRYKTYASVSNAATAVWQHCITCAKDNLKVSDTGPKMPAFSMNLRDSIAVMEAKMTTYGGLDFETNYEVVLGGLMQEVLDQRYQAFQDLVNHHKVSQKVLKAGGGKPFGINVPLWRLIANGQMFNQRYLHPWYDLGQFQEESDKCIMHCLMNGLQMQMQRSHGEH